jgi:uncharacterized repeat protein (TIGR01451 family)
VRSPIGACTEIRDQAVVRFASGTLGSPDSVATNPTITAVQTPNLRVQKTSPPLVRGTVVPITITARNDGQAPTDGEVVVTDDLLPTLVPQAGGAGPPGGPGWTCAVTGQRVQCRRSDPLPAGQAYPPLTVPVFVDPALPQQVVNDATVSGGGDGDTADNTAHVVFDIVPVTVAELTIDKVALDLDPRPGAPARFRVTVHNPGLVPASGVTMSDPLPVSLGLVSATPSQGSCSGALTCALGTVAPQSSVTIDVATTPSAAAAGSRVANAATASAANAPAVSASAAIDVAPLADLAVTKTASDRSPNVGAPVAFTLTARNEGPSPAAGVTLTDVLPDGFAATSAALAGRPCAIDPGTVACAVGDLPAGGQAQAVVQGSFSRSSRGEAVTNHAQVAGEGIDPAPGNDTAESDLVVGPAADLDLTKVGPDDPVRAGETATFRLFLRNRGPDAARDAEITDVLPAGLSYASSSRDCDVRRSGGRDRVTCALGTVPVGRTIEIALRVEAGAALADRTVSNAASASTATPDPVSSNDRGVATLEVGSGADLVMTKLGPTDPRPPGAEVVWVLTVANRGPSEARDVRVEDVAPPGLRPADATASQGGCRVADDGLACVLGVLPARGSAHVVVLATSDPLAGPGPFTNVALATSPTPDANDADNRGAAEVRLAPPGRPAPPAALDVDTSAAAGPNGLVTVTTIVTNDGGAPATGVTVVDTVGGAPRVTPVSAGPRAVGAASRG